MNNLFRTKNETWKKIQSNLLFIAAAEFLIYNGGLMIQYPVSRMINFFTPIVGDGSFVSVPPVSMKQGDRKERTVPNSIPKNGP